MGVDARILVKNFGDHLNDLQIRQKASSLVAAIGRESFFFNRENNQHAITSTEEFWQDGDSILPQKGEQLLTVHVMSRYYGEGYERGHWPELRAIIQWLRQNFDVCEVWYGGDSSGVCASLMDDVMIAEIDYHFNSVGHDPYQGYFGRDKNKPRCVFCGDREMIDVGGGQGKKFFSCMGCGDKWIMTSNSAMIKVEEGKDFFQAMKGTQP